MADEKKLLTPLQHVYVGDSVYHHCVTHALSTEREEVMGLLLGRITPDGHAHLFAAETVPRSDKRTDRVEIPPESLVAVTERAEALTAEVGEKVRVIGWYHSHPHITPFPSHVDLASQAIYQSMEPRWVGLIFSCFNVHKATQRGSLTLHSFQTLVEPGSGAHLHAKIPVSVVPVRGLIARPPAPFRGPETVVDLLQHEARSALEDIETQLLAANGAAAVSSSSTGGADGMVDGATAAARDLAHVLYQYSAHRNVNVVAVEARNALRHQTRALEAELVGVEAAIARMREELGDDDPAAAGASAAAAA